MTIITVDGSSKEIDIEEVRGSEGRGASAYSQGGNFTLSPVSGYICEVSGSPDSSLQDILSSDHPVHI